MSNVVSLNDHLEKTWDAYVAAQKLATMTGDIQDGIAAGRAWRRWLDLHMSAEQRDYLGQRASA